MCIVLFYYQHLIQCIYYSVLYEVVILVKYYLGNIVLFSVKNVNKSC